MKRYIANVVVELSATSIEARAQLLQLVASGLGHGSPALRLVDGSIAHVRSASVGRVRPKRQR